MWFCSATDASALAPTMFLIIASIMVYYLCTGMWLGPPRRKTMRSSMKTCDNTHSVATNMCKYSRFASVSTSTHYTPFANM